MTFKQLKFTNGDEIIADVVDEEKDLEVGPRSEE